jgi:hypothetical protein
MPARECGQEVVLKCLPILVAARPWNGQFTGGQIDACPRQAGRSTHETKGKPEAMSNENKPQVSSQEISDERRAFLMKAGKTAVAAPAAALLLAATAKAVPALSGRQPPPV